MPSHTMPNGPKMYCSNTFLFLLLCYIASDCDKGILNEAAQTFLPRCTHIMYARIALYFYPLSSALVTIVAIIVVGIIHHVRASIRCPDWIKSDSFSQIGNIFGRPIRWRLFTKTIASGKAANASVVVVAIIIVFDVVVVVTLIVPGAPWP